jgi:hypothetical protein
MPFTETLATVRAAEILTPLRHASSMPMIVRADDGHRYVVKMHGAGQGTAALVAEVVIGALATVARLRVAPSVLVELDAATISEHRHDEVVDLIARSQGTNLGFLFMDGAVPYDPALHRVNAAFATRLIAFDTFVWNVDRTAKNPNLLVDGISSEPLCIDHGASPLFYGPSDALIRSPAAAIRANHVLAPIAAAVVDPIAAMTFWPDALAAAVARVPAAWLSAPDAERLLAILRTRADALRTPS